MKQLTNAQLKNRRLWRPRYGRYNRGVMLARLDAIAEQQVAPHKAVVQTRFFINLVFDQFESKERLTKNYGFIFAVPTRISRTSKLYASEATHFVPIIKYLDQSMRQRFISGLPPAVIDEYYDKDGKAVGAVLFVPLFIDMLTDVRNRLRLKLIVNRIIRDVAKFAHHNLGAEIVGLGATLPKLTRYGNDIRTKGLLTTTGHGGTVYMIYKIYKEIETKYKIAPDVLVGVVGCGAIGEASAALLLATYPDIRIIMHDRRPQQQQQVVARLRKKYGDRAFEAHSNVEVLTKARVIVSAITSRIQIPPGVDLKGKVIIDDSQPGSFNGRQVRERGGTLVWVVAHDNTKNSIITRPSGYRFGDDGLLNVGDIWGCEAEVAALWMTKRFDLALNDAVTPESALAIGAEMDKVGVSIAKWQYQGKPVELRKPETGK
jgi:predicted amino acid dehydrogenase